MSAHLSSAQALMVEVFAYYKHHVTEFEGRMWMAVIEQFGDDVIRRFLDEHCKRSAFAPRVNELLDMVAPGRNDSSVAMLELADAVKRYGPWESPTFKDPLLPEAVRVLGGWVAVNEQLPLPESRFDYEAFVKRFEAAYSVSRARSVLGQGDSVPLLGLHKVAKSNAALLEARS